ncbi:hypothetical protein BD410DRAFT_2171 [Rickenella mellea]|uniref:Uncharacterized protein n=1 Tax=Rickenella mellea TaxID=50990 RepID=A0A4R5XFG7_9AGAM|nr:hypothetical protein BD410DRAFT_2171 [Rickenella mellea]
MDTSTKEKHTTVSKPRQTNPHRKGHRAKVYGYALKTAWMVEFAAIHNMGVEEDVYQTASKVMLWIMPETRMGSFCTIKCDNGHRNTSFCLQLGNNWSRSGMVSATKEKIETAKRVLEMEEEPKWYIAD